MLLPRSTWSRWLLALFATAILVLIALYRHWDVCDNDLRCAVAELDRSEPGWRLEQLEANRRVVADVDNGALVVVAARRLLPKNWESISDELEVVPPQTRLQPELLAELNQKLEAADAAVAESRKLLGYRTGRFPIVYSQDYLTTKVDLQYDGLGIAILLDMDAVRAQEDGKSERAASSIRAMLNVGRCFDDEPTTIAQLIRYRVQGTAVRSLERALAQGSVADADLAALQAALKEEAAAPRLYVALRGHRAGMFVFLNRCAADDHPASVQARNSFWSPNPRTEENVLDHIADIAARPTIQRANAWHLQHATKVVETAKLTGVARYDAFRALDREVDERRARCDVVIDCGMLILLNWMGPHTKFADAERRTDTLLHCAIAGAAAERFRLTNGRWPASLEELVDAKLLDAVPEDLYAGTPLRFRRAADGIVIHSVGAKRKYMGDALDLPAEPDPEFTRLEFRLWDPEHRRQPPLPPKKKVDVDES